MGWFDNLKVTFYMRTPLILGWPYIHFDSLIAHTLLRDELGDRYYVLPAKKAEDIVVDILRSRMPILRTKHNGHELWHASVSIIDEKILGGVTIYKRFDARHIGLTKTKKKRVEIVRGHYKAYAMRMPLIVTRKVEFYVSGEIEEISRLIRYIPALGKKRAYGFGDIKKYKVEVLDEDCSLIKNNMVMRPIPIQAFTKINIFPDKTVVSRVAYKPPYWWKQNVELCVMPYSRIGDYIL